MNVHRTWIFLLSCGLAAAGCGGSSTSGARTNQDGGAGTGTGGAAGTAGTGGGGTAGTAGSGGGGEGGTAGAGGSPADAGKICGTIAGLTCGPDQWCDYQPSSSGKNYCGGDDSGGYCRQKPQGCTADCPGVCGCDGKFYCNACGAHAAGTDDTTDTSCMHDGGASGTPCQGDGDCASGLKCCYPCGIPGCSNQCMQPDSNGQCPAFP